MNFRQRAFCILSLLAFMPSAQAFEAVSVLPVDESYKDPSLQDFRNTLLAAIVARDIEKVVQMADDNIMLSFGGNGGKQELRQNFELHAEAYWMELERALRMGGYLSSSHENTAFWAPYIWSDTGLDNLDDPFAAWVVIGQDVNVRESPDSTSPSLVKVGYELVLRRQVETQLDARDMQWVPIETADGTQGWIAEPFLRQLLDLRIGFERFQGQWHWTHAIAGD